MVQNVKNWLENQNDTSIQDREKQYLEKDGDLMAIVPRPMSLLRRFLESINWLGMLDLFLKDKRAV